MTQNPKKVEKLTTDQAMRKLFPKPVIEEIKREIAEPDTGGGTSVRPSKPSMKRD